MTRPNYFVALPFVSEPLARRLTERPPPLMHRAFTPEDLHITVAFLGPCGGDAAAAAWRTRDRAPSLLALEVSLGEVVPLGPPRRPSALSARLREGRAEVERFMAASRDLFLDAAGAPRERRPPLAHVTLARPQRRADDSARAEGLRWAAALDVTDISATLDRIALYTWSEDRATHLFRVVAEASLSR